MTPPPDAVRPRLLLLLPTSTYRTEAFVTAADRLAIDLAVASERPSAFERANQSNLVTLPFDDAEATVAEAREFADRHPIAAVFGVDDRTVVLAARIARALDLPHNPVAAMEAAANKHHQRLRLAEGGVAIPPFRLCHTGDPLEPLVASLAFPAVIKPLRLAASRGVMRVDSPQEARAAVRRLAVILDEAEGVPGPAGHAFLGEHYVPGDEYALEGLLDDGELRVLALFDKPEPLEGPTFAETLYVTPSLAPGPVQATVVRCAAAACRALGLHAGPIHAEVRHNAEGAWLIELAARPIGGKCGEVLRFGAAGEVSLEQLHLARAVGVNLPAEREPVAAGVAMLPVPRKGRFTGVTGLEEARAVPGIERVIITVPVGQRLRPLPDEARYVGFIFARGPNAASVTAALHSARDRLQLHLDPLSDEDAPA